MEKGLHQEPAQSECHQDEQGDLSDVERHEGSTPQAVLYSTPYSESRIVPYQNPPAAA
jgi:hypothetical protein